MSEGKIKLISQIEVVERFGHIYKKENLSCAPMDNTYWYANEYTCGSLYWKTPTKVRIKGTVTLPEYRGLGHGNAMLTYLITKAQNMADNFGRHIQIESYARNPKWYLEHGFEIHNVTAWGVTVVKKQLGYVGEEWR
jgi:ribosomal protein S18 acetylase RimI-like enzyme